MGRVYSVVFEGVAVSVAQDLFELSPADDKPIRLLGLFISQHTEVGDAAEEMLRISIIRGKTTSGSGGSAATPTPIDPSDVAAGFSAEVNNTTVATNGTVTVIHAESFNERTGLAMFWTPETAPKANQGNTTLVVRLLDAPGDSVTMNGTLYVEEL